MPLIPALGRQRQRQRQVDLRVQASLVYRIISEQPGLHKGTLPHTKTKQNKTNSQERKRKTKLDFFLMLSLLVV
jgi:predicted nucleic acid-binding Zn ribbon protein